MSDIESDDSSNEDQWVARESGPVSVSAAPSPPLGTRERRATGRTPRRDTIRKKVVEWQQPRRPKPEELLAASYSLKMRLSGVTDEAVIVDGYLDVFRILLSGRRLVVRLVRPDDDTPALVRATSRVLPETRDQQRVTRQVLDCYNLPDSVVPETVRIVDRYRPDFESEATGFDFPLLEDDSLVGVMGVEYALGANVPPDDPAVIGQFALQLSTALGRARLKKESLRWRSRVRNLLEHADVPFISIGRDGLVRSVSEGFVSVVASPREDIVGRHVDEMMSPAERERFAPILKRALDGAAMRNIELRLRCRGGGAAPFAFNLAAVPEVVAGQEGVMAIGRDLSEVRELEEQVVQAEKLATLGQLAAGVVHELNNPLTSISVYSEHLLKTRSEAGAEDEELERIRRIVRSAERILRFTRDLVAYARPATEAADLLSMHQVVDQAIVFCEHVIAESGVEVCKSYATNVRNVSAVRGQLHQVFINLITNACHAMPHGAGRLHVAVDESADDHVEVKIRDNGAGIPADQQGAIFEPFYSTKGEGKGTGLGLSIVRNIVRQHGGQIHVSSVVGEGAVFVVRLPAVS